MKAYVKEFAKRGLMFGGFGPIVLGIVYFIISMTVEGFVLSGADVLLGIVSTYALAFIHAGTSIFHQIERLSVPIAALLQLGILYLAYTASYLVNSWIPKNSTVIIIYTVIFVIGYAAIYLGILISTKLLCKKLNGKIKG